MQLQKLSTETKIERDEYTAPPEAHKYDIYSKLERNNIPALDGIRGIAALIVVVSHLHLRSLSWAPDGSLGVLVFFVLSGFLITWLLLKEADETGNISLRGFYLRRSLRIFPAFYVCWAVNLAALLATLKSIKGVPWIECLTTFFYAGDYYYPFHDNQRFMGFSWSLAVEEQFYLIWPFVFCACRNRRATLAKWLVVVIVGVWAHRAVLKFVFHVPEHYLSYALDCHIDHLMVGALAAITLRSGWLCSFWRAACRPRWALVSIALLAVSISLQHHFEHAYDHTVGFILDPLVIAVVLTQMASLEALAPFSWLNLPVARFVGRISYPLYLYHIFAIQLGYQLFSVDNWRLSVVASLILAVTFATASYYLVEMPFLRLKSRFARRPLIRTASLP